MIMQMRGEAMKKGGEVVMEKEKLNSSFLVTVGGNKGKKSLFDGFCVVAKSPYFNEIAVF